MGGVEVQREELQISLCHPGVSLHPLARSSLWFIACSRITRITVNIFNLPSPAHPVIYHHLSVPRQPSHTGTVRRCFFAPWPSLRHAALEQH